ncbi:hypothetical protein ACI2K4_27615 [Micromonospora sp. NPDC050397]|uniref:mechanosensitive ion channel family protein n=1 Tax=Micromonospora sp. NPDC050397 TaxID=3364279 RepID=UPI00384D09DC
MPAIVAVRRVDVGSELSETWNALLIFVPRLIGCLGILVLGWLLARFVLRTALRLLDRFGFDQVVQRGGLGRLVARTRYRPAAVLARLAYYLILLFTVQLGFAIWGPNPVHDIASAVVAWLPRAFVALVVVAVSVVIANAVHDLVSDSVGAVSYGRPLADVVSLLVVGLGVVAAFVQTGVATSVTGPVLVALLATVAGILVVGIGGGLVKPMQVRWERWLGRLASESRLRRANRETYGRGSPFAVPYAESAGRAPVPPTSESLLTGSTFPETSFPETSLSQASFPEPSLLQATIPDTTLTQMPTSPAPESLAGYEPVTGAGPTGYQPVLDGGLAGYEPALDSGLTGYDAVPDGLAGHSSDLLTPAREESATGEDDGPRFRPQDA